MKPQAQEDRPRGEGSSQRKPLFYHDHHEDEDHGEFNHGRYVDYEIHDRTARNLKRPKLTWPNLDPHGITCGADLHLMDAKLFGDFPGSLAWQTIISQTR